MKLTIYERFILEEILPDHGTMLQIITMQSIRNKTKITVKDIAKYSIKDNTKTGNIDWDRSIDNGEEFELDPAEIEFLKNRYKELDERHFFNDNTYSLLCSFRYKLNSLRIRRRLSSSTLLYTLQASSFGISIPLVLL